MSNSKIKFRECILKIKPYVPGKPIEAVQKEYNLKDVIKLASNENPLGPSPNAIKKMQEVATLMALYPDGYCTELREELSKKLRIEKDRLIFGNGSDEIIKLIGEAFIEEGDEVIVGDPSFSEYDFVCLLMGGTLVKVPLKNHTHDLKKMVEQISDKTKIIFICNPNNPTGTMVSKREIEDFIASVPEHVLIVFDEAYKEYIEDKEYPETIDFLREGRKNIIILRTFSKIHGLAGLRIGYGIASADIIQLLERTREPFNVNLMAQKAAVASLQDDEHIEKSKDLNAKGKRYLYEVFEKMGLSYIPTQANFIMVNLEKNSKEVFVELLKRGVIVRTGDIFGMDNYIRVTVGTDKQNSRFIDALREVLKL